MLTIIFPIKENLMPDRFGDLIFVIPGIMGSRLVRIEGNKTVPVWDLSVNRLPAAIADIIRGGLVFIGSGDAAPNDGVVTNGLLEIPQWLPDFFGVDGYAQLVKTLKERLGNEQVREFPYDWRLSNAYSARLLRDTAEPALDAWRRSSGNTEARLVLIGHSMGGLIARYYCEALGGAALVSVVISIGTPHLGAIPALDGIVNGKKFFKILDMSKELRSLPSVYELLPIYPCLTRDGRQPQKLDDVAVTVPNLDLGRWSKAKYFHDGIRIPALKRAQEGIPCPYEQIVFYNRRQPTSLSARLNGNRLEYSPHGPFNAHEGNPKSGDGTVPWFSAIPIDWNDDGAAIAAPNKHAALQTAPSIIDTITNRLKPDSVIQYKGAPINDQSVITFRLSNQAIQKEDPVEVIVRTGRPGNLRVTLTHLAKDGTRRKRFRDVDPGGGVARFEQLEEGVHQVLVAPVQPALETSLPPVTDYVLVIGNESAT
jgi:pimeloyl-ACP methyl ester carboxylesterase